MLIFLKQLLRAGSRPKKGLLLMAGPLRGWGGGVKGRAIKEKIIFFGTFFSNVPKFLTAIKLEGDRGVRP